MILKHKMGKTEGVITGVQELGSSNRHRCFQGRKRGSQDKLTLGRGGGMHGVGESWQGESQKLTYQHYWPLVFLSLSAPLGPSVTACHFVNTPTAEEPLCQGQ